MNKNIVSLEISHKYIKVVFGYVQNEQIFVTYTKKVPIDHLIENGLIVEKEELIKELSKINPVIDQASQINELINNVILNLPPYGLEVYKTKQMMSVSSAERVISEIDIINIYNGIRNKNLPVDNVLIDIIPESFSIDNGNMYAQAPIGKVTNVLTALVKVHTIPKRINAEFSEVLKGANISIDRKVISTFAASELIATYPDAPTSYFLVDIGASSTSVSLIGNKQLLATRSFSWGGDKITDKIVSKFNINENEAEKIKILYGLDKRDIKFKYIVSKEETPEGYIKHDIEELNELIESELENFYKGLNIALEQLALLYKVNDYQSLPFLLIGGSSQLKGLKEFLLNKNTYTNITPIAPRNIGARDPSLFSLIGSIYVQYKYPNSFNVNKQIQVKVSREE